MNQQEILTITPKIKQRNNAIRAIVGEFFKDRNGEHYKMTDGQCEMFHKITDKSYRWVWQTAPTRYGKSEILAIGLIYLAAFHNLKIPIVGGSEEKAKKIMEYVVQHIADHPKLSQGLLNVGPNSSKQEKIDQLKVQLSKQALRWAGGGWIYVTSVDARSTSKGGEGVVGEGGDIVVLEEAGLIKDEEQFSKVIRMPEWGNGWGKLIMSGNCIEKSVFKQAYESDLYVKTHIKLDQAIKEGRFDEQEIEDKKSQTTTKDWKRYYIPEFPKDNEFTYFKPTKYEVLPNDLKFYGALDPALGESKKGSLVGIVVLGLANDGQIYEVESIGEQLKPDETIRTIFNLPYKFERFGIEAVQFQKYFYEQITKQSKSMHKHIPFQPIQQQRKKEERIDSLEPYISTGQILFKGDNLLWEHMQDYPELEDLDILDALEMAVRPVLSSKFDFSFI